jgi:hypothetical protein
MSWSVDSRYLAFTLENELERHNIIYLMDIQKLSVAQVLDTGTSIELGDWSPNHQYILIGTLNQIYLYSVIEDKLEHLNSDGVRWLDNNSMIYSKPNIEGGFSYFIQQIHEPFPKNTDQQIHVIGVLAKISPDNKYILAIREDSSFGVAGLLCYENIQSQSVKCLPDFLYRYTSANWVQN